MNLYNKKERKELEDIKTQELQKLDTVCEKCIQTIKDNILNQEDVRCIYDLSEYKQKVESVHKHWEH